MMDRFAHISGNAALDVMNTVDWRLNAGRRIEQLLSWNDVLAWVAESGFVQTGEQQALSLRDTDAACEAAWRAFVAMRETAYAAIFLQQPVAVAALADMYRDASSDAVLLCSDAGWVWQDATITLHTPQHRVVRGLVELMMRPEIAHLHQCADADCGWVFLDTSPRHNRRWCSPKGCGDRNRARIWYARQKES